MSSPTPARTQKKPSASLVVAWHNARHPPADITDKDTFRGKTVLVTGANAGLGFQAAVKYANVGVSVLALAVRTEAKGEATKAEILRLSGRRTKEDDPASGIDIRIFPVDLSTFASVRAFVAALDDPVSDLPHLDVALLNAGIAAGKFSRSSDGYEMAVQVNVLASALMAILLLPKLRASAAVAAQRGDSVHLTFVNSIGHTSVERKHLKDGGGKLWDATHMDEKNFDAIKAYVLVKLLAMVVIDRIVEATRGDEGLVVNSCCPGLCRTSLGREFGAVMKAFMACMHSVLARTAEEGSRTLVSATTLGKESHGGFWMHDTLAPKNPLLQDKQLVNDAWNTIVQILKQADPEVETILSEKYPV